MSPNEQKLDERTPPRDVPRGWCRGGRWAWRIPFIVIGMVLLRSALAMFLWNHLIPPLFHGPEIDLLQAVGLFVLVKVLMGHGFRPGFGHRWPPWARRHHMSHEDRLKLREELRNRCTSYSSNSSTNNLSKE